MPTYLPKPPFPRWVVDDEALYSAPGTAYDGTPRIVAPTSGEQGLGLVPSKATVGAQQHNWLFGRWSAMTEALVHSVMRSFRGFVIAPSIVSVGDVSMGAYDTIEDGAAESYTIVSPLWTDRFQKPMMIAVGNEVGSGMQRRYGSDGHHWTNVSDVSLEDGDMDVESFRGTSPDDPNRGYTIHASSADDDIWVFHGTAVGTLITPDEIADVAPSGFGIGCVRQASSGFLLGVAGGGTTTSRIITTYPDAPSDGTFTTRTVPASWNTTTIHNIVATGDAGIAGTTETIVAVGNRSDEVLVSHDSGQSWAVSSVPFGRGGWDSYQLAYSSTHKLFMLINSDFRVMISEDGDSWSVIQSADLDGFITSIADRGRLLAAAGPCFALAVNRNALDGTITRRGVMYTFDLANWHFVDFGLGREDITHAQMLGIREWGGGFVVWGSGQGFVCPPLYLPDAETMVPG